MNYYSIGEFANKLNITTQTLRNWDKEGKLKPHHVSDGKHRYYLEEQLRQILRVPFKKEKKVIGHCRVSSNKQKNDLERQIENVKTYI